ADVFGFDSNFLVELFFKRQDHQHAIDVAAQRSNSVLAPRPYLGADVIDDLEAFAMKLAREPHVEVRPVDQHDCRRTPASSGTEQRSVRAIEPAKRASYFGHSDDCNLARVDERLDSRGAHLVAPRAEQFEFGLWIKLL